MFAFFSSLTVWAPDTSFNFRGYRFHLISNICYFPLRETFFNGWDEIFPSAGEMENVFFFIYLLLMLRGRRVRWRQKNPFSPSRRFDISTARRFYMQSHVRVLFWWAKWTLASLFWVGGYLQQDAQPRTHGHEASVFCQNEFWQLVVRRLAVSKFVFFPHPQICNSPRETQTEFSVSIG